MGLNKFSFKLKAVCYIIFGSFDFIHFFWSEVKESHYSLPTLTSNNANPKDVLDVES